MYGVLGLHEDEAHVIRNARAGPSPRTRSVPSPSANACWAPREIVLIHHTDCGMPAFTDDAFKQSTQDETGIRPSWAAEAFTDLDADVRQSIARIRANPFIPRKDSIRGFGFDVATGRLTEVV